ncbi:MAG TPA: class I SAM-dependent methyltransferase [Acidimicrobiales bacterium]
MEKVTENYFTEHLARNYAALWPHLFEPGAVIPAVDFLSALAPGGAALEFGVGTGRLALPLSARGIEVHGIDLSPEMLEELAHQPGAATVRVTLGDIASTRVAGGAGSYELVYLVRNTIMNLTTQDAQVECFANAAWHLRPGGKFVIEVMVPELRRLPPGTTVRAFSTGPRHFGFEEYDVATQDSVSFHVFERDGKTETFSAPFRHVWPAELDLMARLAGLVRRERWSDWDRAPFTSESRSHVSVWEKVDGPTEA